MAADQVVQKMSQAGQRQAMVKDQEAGQPKKGEHYRCGVCGMAMEVTADCGCKEDHAHAQCCGQPMQKV